MYAGWHTKDGEELTQAVDITVVDVMSALGNTKGNLEYSSTMINM